ncbi:response regulator transcription factor [Streptomyces sp. WAC06614]|uniref:response regulator transcription factor n=1 Tax=Streptomyces sp. WAC06614 TaxID=2487416 RepID=UPI000F769247|nr:response regulator transcription factor [Streptomyces sp. WAC06614]RSS64725.1 DNA-binding response regulator [Streptomyces sp. WAC06614]
MIKVLIADDEALVRTGLRMILQADPDIEVVAEACDGDEALDRIRAHRPDVVLMDIRMPHLDGLAATRQLSTWPDAPRVLVLTTFDRDEYVHTALQSGAAGFLFKDTPPRELTAAVRTVAEGSAILAPRVTKHLIDHFTRGSAVRTEARRRLAALTPRELDVLAAVAEGRSNAEAARALHLSEATVKSHVSQIMAKLGATNRVQIAVLAHQADAA